MKVSETPSVNLVITDVDNTLFDWVEQWYHSFSAMLEKTLKITGLPRDRLIAEIKAVHQRHGTSEYAFLLNELPAVRRLANGASVLGLVAPAIVAFREARERYLHLYPGVKETLEEIKARGASVVGYTESMEPYTIYRLKELGLDGLLATLYSPKGHDIPDNIELEWFEHHRFFECTLTQTTRRHTPPGHFKPDPTILISMLGELGADPQRTIYVGDSLTKDVAMAQHAGVLDVYARYGIAQERPEYALLREVTHWTTSDVEREKIVTETDVVPSCVLETSFSELLRLFHFSGV